MISMLFVASADAYGFVIFVYVMMSWIPMGGGIVTDVYHALGKICDAYLTCSGASFLLLEEWWTLAQSWHCLCYSFRGTSDREIF